MSAITRTYTFTDGTTAYGSQVESEIANIVTSFNNQDSGAASWTHLVASDGRFGATDISVTTAQVRVNGDISVGGADRKIFNVDNNSLALGVNNTAKLTILATGVVQIGSTLGAGSGVLTVNGDINVGGANRNILNATNNSLGLGTNNTVQITITAAGLLTFNSAGMFSANSNVATAMSSVGPAGSHTTIQKWFTVSDGSNTLYIPCF